MVSTGVYAFVRHPMYLGAVCMMIGAPLFQSSLLGVGIGLLMSGLVMARIIGEERVLVDRLEQYQDYRNQVKYRLISYLC